MLIPSRTKYRRVHRLPHEGKSRGNTTLSFGEYGLQAKKGAWSNIMSVERMSIQVFWRMGSRGADDKIDKSTPPRSMQMLCRRVQTSSIEKDKSNDDFHSTGAGAPCQAD